MNELDASSFADRLFVSPLQAHGQKARDNYNRKLSFLEGQVLKYSVYVKCLVSSSFRSLFPAFDLVLFLVVFFALLLPLELTISPSPLFTSYLQGDAVAARYRKKGENKEARDLKRADKVASSGSAPSFATAPSLRSIEDAEEEEEQIQSERERRGSAASKA